MLLFWLDWIDYRNLKVPDRIIILDIIDIIILVHLSDVNHYENYYDVRFS